MIVAFAVVAVSLPPLGAASEEVLIAKDVAELSPGKKGRPVVKLVVWIVRVLVTLTVTYLTFRRVMVIVFIDDAGRTAAMSFANRNMTLGARTCVPLFPAIVKQPFGAQDPVGAATVIVLFG